MNLLATKLARTSMASPNSAHESPKLTLRKLISELKGLLERERIALDL